MAIPDPLPDEIRLTPSRRKWFRWTAISVGLVVLCSYAASHGVDAAWLGLGPAGIGVLVFGAQLTGLGTYLELNRKGFVQSTLGRKIKLGWDEVSDFGIWVPPGGSSSMPLVRYRRACDSGGLASFSKALSGGTAILGNTSNIPAEELAALMTAFRARALAETGTGTETVTRPD